MEIKDSRFKNTTFSFSFSFIQQQFSHFRLILTHKFEINTVICIHLATYFDFGITR